MVKFTDESEDSAAASAEKDEPAVVSLSDVRRARRLAAAAAAAEPGGGVVPLSALPPRDDSRDAAPVARLRPTVAPAVSEPVPNDSDKPVWARSASSAASVEIGTSATEVWADGQAADPEPPRDDRRSSSSVQPRVVSMTESRSARGKPLDDASVVGLDDQIDETMLNELRFSDADKAVVRALSRKDRSEWEVVQLLLTNGIEQHETDEFIQRYRESGYLDDQAYAERQVESLRRRKGLGRSQLSSELSAKRIAPEIIAEVLDQFEPESELDRATELAAKRASSLARLDRETAERRLTGFLLRKGYSSSVVREVVSAALAGSHRGSTVRFR